MWWSAQQLPPQKRKPSIRKNSSKTSVLAKLPDVKVDVKPQVKTAQARSLEDKRADLHAAMVAQRLFLGDRDAAMNRDWLLANGVVAVVNCTLQADAYPHDFCYFDVPVDDDSGAPIRDYLHDASIFIEQQLERTCVEHPSAVAAASAGRWWATGPCVLVHCQGGRSRSAIVVLAHLLRTSSPTSLEDLFVRITRSRPIFPNAGFTDALREEARALGVECSSDELPGVWPKFMRIDDVRGGVLTSAAAVRSNIRRWKSRLDKLHFLAANVTQTAAEFHSAGFALGITPVMIMVTACEDCFGAMHFGALRDLLREIYTCYSNAGLLEDDAAEEMECALSTHLLEMDAEANGTCHQVYSEESAMLVGRCVADAVVFGVLRQDFVDEQVQAGWPDAAKEARAELNSDAVWDKDELHATQNVLLTSAAVQAGYQVDKGEIDELDEPTLACARQRLARGGYVPSRVVSLLDSMSEVDEVVADDVPT